MNKLTPEEFWYVDQVPEPVEDRGSGRIYPLQVARVLYERERRLLEDRVIRAEQDFVREHNDRISMEGEHFRHIPPSLWTRITAAWRGRKRRRWHSAELAWEYLTRRMGR